VRKRLPDYLDRFRPRLVVLWAAVNNKYSALAPTDLVIEGNQFSLLGRCTAIRFPDDPAVPARIRGVEVGVNSNRCPTYLAGFEADMSLPSSQAGPQTGPSRMPLQQEAQPKSDVHPSAKQVPQ
jgi:hypothetical protein